MSENSNTPSKGLAVARTHRDGLKRQKFRVDAWGLTVYWHPLSYEDLTRFSREFEKDNGKACARLLVRVLEDDDGKKLFRPDEATELMRAAHGPTMAAIASAVAEIEIVAEAKKILEN